MAFVHDDGGREAAAIPDDKSDCVCRAVSIATGTAYREVYDALSTLAEAEHVNLDRYGRPSTRGVRSSPNTGVRQSTTRHYLESQGWVWVSMTQAGQGCSVHLSAGELPTGSIVVVVEGHTVAVINGVIHDTEDPSEGGTRPVYGYFFLLSP